METQLEWKKYKDLPTPKPKELIGRWDIEMDGWRKILLNNVKVIQKKPVYDSEVFFQTGLPEVKYIGYNIAFWFIKWGEFNVTEDSVLYYRNGKIVDWIVNINKDVKKGLYIKDGKPRCTFTMRRIRPRIKIPTKRSFLR